jgi:hypothetical protein
VGSVAFSICWSRIELKGTERELVDAKQLTPRAEYILLEMTEDLPSKEQEFLTKFMSAPAPDWTAEGITSDQARQHAYWLVRRLLRITAA